MTNAKSRRQHRLHRTALAPLKRFASWARRTCVKLLSTLTTTACQHHSRMKTSKAYRDSFRKTTRKLINRIPAGRARTIADTLRHLYFGVYKCVWGI